MNAMTRGIVAIPDAHMRQVVGMALESEGGTWLEVASGLGAFVLARRILPDVVLLSASLPGLAAYTVCRRLKEDGRTAAIAVVILAGEAEVAVGERARAAGADAWLTLPCRPSQVVSVIERLFAHPQRDAWRVASQEEGARGLRPFSAALALGMGGGQRRVTGRRGVWMDG